MLDRLIHPPMTPDQFQEPRWARFLFASTAAAWLWLVIRLYMAYIFIPAGWGKITSGKWLFGDGSPIQGLVGGAVSSEDTPGLVRLVPAERRRAQLRPVRDARRPRRVRRRARAAGRAADRDRGLRWRVPERELHPRGALGSNPALVVLGALFLVVAWRNAGWIGLDRWFIPWTHRTVFEPKSPEGGGTGPTT